MITIVAEALPLGEDDADDDEEEEGDDDADDTDDDALLLVLADGEVDVLLVIVELDVLVVVELVAVEIEDDVDGDVDADAEVVEFDAPVVFTVIVPFIQLGWMEQSYVYVPGVVRVTVNVWPALIVIGESGAFDPLGWVSQWTLCGAPDWLSWSTKLIVLLTPTTTVKVEGWKFSDWSAPTFWGIATVRALPEPLALLELVELTPEDAEPLVEAEEEAEELGVELDDVVVPGLGTKRK